MSNRDPVVYFVTYDVVAPGRLKLVYKTMRGFGDHMQYSVFRCVLSDLQLARLKERILQIIDPDADQVMIIPIGRSTSKRSWRAFSLGVPLKHPERVVKIL